MGGFRDLEVWQEAISLAEAVYRATDQMPTSEIYGLTGQIRRAAVSIAANIAEGAGRNSKGEFHQFVGIAFGSQNELITLLVLAKSIYSLPNADELMERYEVLGKRMVALKHALKGSR